MTQSESCRPIEVTGQVRGVQMNPPGEGNGGGTFQLLLENGDIIASPYLAEWHQDIASALQANDIFLIKVKGIGEHSPGGVLRRIVEPDSITRCWAPAPNRLFETKAPGWESLLGTRSKTE